MICETQVSQDQEHVLMASVLNRPPKMEAVVSLAVDVGVNFRRRCRQGIFSSTTYRSFRSLVWPRIGCYDDT